MSDTLSVMKEFMPKMINEKEATPPKNKQGGGD